MTKLFLGSRRWFGLKSGRNGSFHISPPKSQPASCLPESPQISSALYSRDLKAGGFSKEQVARENHLSFRFKRTREDDEAGREAMGTGSSFSWFPRDRNSERGARVPRQKLGDASLLCRSASGAASPPPTPPPPPPPACTPTCAFPRFGKRIESLLEGCRRSSDRSSTFAFTVSALVGWLPATRLGICVFFLLRARRNFLRVNVAFPVHRSSLRHRESRPPRRWKRSVVVEDEWGRAGCAPNNDLAKFESRRMIVNYLQRRLILR